MKKTLAVLVMGAFAAPAFAPVAEAAVDREAFRAWRMAQMESQMDIFNNMQVEMAPMMEEAVMENMEMNLIENEDVMMEMAEEIDPMLVEMMMQEDMGMMEGEMVMPVMVPSVPTIMTRAEKRIERNEDRISVIKEKNPTVVNDRMSRVDALINTERRDRVIRRRGKRFSRINSSKALTTSQTLTRADRIGNASNSLVQAKTLTTW